ncbi:hypothetical protein N0V91_011327, partial [Didymella pomorum]
MLSASDSHRRRKKDKDDDRSKDKDKDKDKEGDAHRRHKSSRPHKSRSSGSKEDVAGVRCVSSSSHKMAGPAIPELGRRSSIDSGNGSRVSLPYPTVNKNYSKESIYARDDVDRKKTTTTPDDDAVPPTPTRAPPPPPRAPPSPPLTATNPADLRKTASANSSRRTSEALHREMEAGRRSVDNSTRVSTPSGQRHTASRSSVREQDSMTDLTSTTGSQPSTVRAKSPRAKSPTAVPTRTKTASPAGGRIKTSSSKTYKAKTKPRGSSELTLDSENTSVPLYRARRTRSPAYSDASPASVVDSSPRTPTQHSVLPSVIFDDKDRPATVEILDPISRESS